MPSRPLLITSNGFGMGHLVRQLALSRQFDNAAIMTLSGAAPIALRGGARLEYCPSYSVPWMSRRTWHRGYLRDRIVALAEEVNADALVFDGVVPYLGLLNAMPMVNLPAVWLRRGLWRDTAQTWPLKYGPLFDLIIEPGDVGFSHDHGVTKERDDRVRVGVITEAGATLDRSTAAAALGVDPNKPTLLFNIGSNRGLDLRSVELFLAQRRDWNILSTTDALNRARSSVSLKHVSGLFPLYPYLSAVDLAVTSVGYNAAHEFIACAVPTIVMPSDNATDDQYSRADAMVALGSSVRADSGEELKAALSALMSDEQRRAAFAGAARTSALAWRNGASEAAALIGSLTRRPHRHPLRLAVRNAAEQALGIVDRSAGGPPLFTEELDEAMIRGNRPIEHLLANSSPRYRGKREAIASRWLEK